MVYGMQAIFNNILPIQALNASSYVVATYVLGKASTCFSTVISSPDNDYHHYVIISNTMGRLMIVCTLNPHMSVLMLYNTVIAIKTTSPSIQ